MDDNRVREKLDEMTEVLNKLKELLELKPDKNVRIECVDYSQRCMVIREMKRLQFPMDRITVAIKEDRSPFEIIAPMMALAGSFIPDTCVLSNKAQSNMANLIKRDEYSEEAAAELRLIRASKKLIAFAKRNRK